MITVITFTDGTVRSYSSVREVADDIWDEQYPDKFNTFRNYISSFRALNGRTKGKRTYKKFGDYYNIAKVDVIKEERPKIEPTGREREPMVSDNPYHDLAQAVITQAINDYFYGNISVQSFYEFCISDWFEVLSMGDMNGQWIFDQVKDRRKRGLEI